jgi:hypothetical protein
VFVVWLFSGATEPDTVQTAAHPPADRAPAVASSSASSLAAVTTTPQAASTTTVELPERAAPPTKAAATAEATAKPPAAADSGPRRVRFLIMPKPDNVNLPITWAKDYVYDRELGRLGILGPWENTIGFISIDEQTGGTIRDVKHVALRGVPRALAYQTLPNGKGIFAVAQTETAGLILIDAESLEIVKALRFDEQPLFLSLVDEPDPRYFYFSTGSSSGQSVIVKGNKAFQGPGGWEGKMQRLDLVSMELDNRFQGEEFRTSMVRSVGNRLFHVFLAFMYLDHERRFMAYNDSVFSNDDGRRLTQLSFQAQWFFSDNALLTGVSKQEIVVGSINDGRIIAGVSLPAVYDKILGRAFERGREHMFAKIFIDPKRNLLVVGLRQFVMIIPIETLGLPNEPILLLDEAPPITTAIGELYEFPLRTVSGEGSFALLEGPEGMTIEGSVLRWRPEVAYTAPVEVKVKTTANDVTREESWYITVE